jgi:L-ascorbate metabolism protein UlaG (beta-lactamase superfamily)
MQTRVTHIDTACVLLEINGFKILTDPTLDCAGGLYYHGFGAFSRKTDDPVFRMEDLMDVDLVLLSHHQHKDNFDGNGQRLSRRVSTVLSTKKASEEIPDIVGLEVWDRYRVPTEKLTNLTITATPAQHRPSWIPEFVSGSVIGFVIEYEEQENGAIYISGDTVYFRGIEEIARFFTVDIGIFHVGRVQFRYLTGWGNYTMNGKELIRAIKTIDPKRAIPVHYRGWSHFKESEGDLKRMLATDLVVSKKTVFLTPGVGVLF